MDNIYRGHKSIAETEVVLFCFLFTKMETATCNHLLSKPGEFLYDALWDTTLTCPIIARSKS